jgi:hypothetical protein
MSTENVAYIKKNWLTFSNIVVLVSFMMYQAKWQERVDSQIMELQQDVSKHIMDREAHQPLKDRIEIFMPRNEIQGILKSIESSLDKIESKLR